MSPSDGTPPHVLMAEDEMPIAMMIQEALDEAGFRVTYAPDGLAALEESSKAHFDILLTDVRMPNLDGVGLVRRLRGSRPEMPIVVLSGYMTNGDREELLRLGVPPDSILEKPVTLGELHNVLRRVLAP
ncbi:response regulator [Roseomonas xinghualingensis]|uniref:response regulator n=1 Tax=Roseomonas xinghualingensis TaxID=2986475 RepID=UPI0021F1ABAF|nr:response regulator [Roseomonas sp. SXEYE001]MCV4206256.1 response regulator [Roseomonas sp. SXEYE001]